MGAVNWVASLKSHYCFPAFFLEHGSGSSRNKFETFETTDETAILTDIGGTIEDLDNRIELDYTNSQVRINTDNNSLDLKLVFSIIGISDQTYQVIEAIRL